MGKINIEDIRFSSSSIDDFFTPQPPRTAANHGGGKIRISSLRELAGFQIVAKDQLIHVSQQDFWKLGQDEEGHFIERLVDDDNGPVKGT